MPMSNGQGEVNLWVGQVNFINSLGPSDAYMRQ